LASHRRKQQQQQGEGQVDNFGGEQAMGTDILP